jgi:Holliday junction resolvase RusA-like endonuclease
LKRRDRQWLALACRNAEVKPASGKRRVSLTVLLAKGTRRRDPDAWWKSILDALVHARALLNDSGAWVELGPVKDVRADRNGMVLLIEDLEETNDDRARPPTSRS